MNRTGSAVILCLLLVVAGCGTEPSTTVATDPDPCAPNATFMKVAQSNMTPTLLAGDVIAISRESVLQRGSVVAVDWQRWTGDIGPNAPERVIGLPGDHVQLLNGKVVVNGSQSPDAFGPTDPMASRPAEWVVPPGAVFVLGDGRQNSADSRQYGFVPLDAVIGRATFVCAPDVRRGPIP